MAAVEGVTEVRPKLYLSGREPATAMKSLTVLGISHIMWLDVELGRWRGVLMRYSMNRSVGSEFPARLDNGALDEKQMKKRKMDGRSSAGRLCWVDLAQHFDDTRLFISEALAQGKVLVHCTEGRSRSVAIVVAFLMQKEKISLGKAHLVDMTHVDRPAGIGWKKGVKRGHCEKEFTRMFL
eukprot:Skav209665  [mRNA]  locus=scaffold2126:175584:179110:+ [translate_table: standard]